MNMSTENPIAMDAFWTDAGGFVTKKIRKITDGDWSHIGVIFHFEQHPSLVCESHLKKYKGKSGVRIYPATDLHKWIAVKKSRKISVMKNVLTDFTDLEYAWKIGLYAAEHVKYAPLQLGRNFMAEVFRVRINSIRSPHLPKWTCSETVSRMMPPLFQIIKLNVGEYGYDYIYPSGGRGGLGLWEVFNSVDFSKGTRQFTPPSIDN